MELTTPSMYQPLHKPANPNLSQVVNISIIFQSGAEWNVCVNYSKCDIALGWHKYASAA